MSFDFRLSKPSSLLLDLVRASAAQAVVIGHGISSFEVAQLPFLQNSAVAVFFVMSGIVIPYSTFTKVDKDPSFSFSSYFVDRFSRIYMGLAPCLLLIVAIDTLNKSLFGSAYYYTRSNSYDVRTFLGNLLMLQDHPFQTVPTRILSQWLSLSPTWFPPITSFGSARQLWTVAIEWWIYLLFGWLALGGPIRLKRPVVYWTGLLFFLAVPWFNWVFGGRGNGLTLMWGMGLVILALLSQAPRSWFRGDALVLAAFFLLASLARVLYTQEAYDVLFVALFSLSLYFVLTDLQQRPALSVPKAVIAFITFTSNFSYTLYLVHCTVLYFLVNWLGLGTRNFVIGFVVSNVLSMALYEMFEKHHRTVASKLKAALGISQIQAT